MKVSPMHDDRLPRSAPWWRSGYVWMLIAGPLAVVIAGIVTAYLAVSRPDPLVTQEPVRRSGDASLAPAQQARNHAATGAVPPPGPARSP